jgi:hypothetical protein
MGRPKRDMEDIKMIGDLRRPLSTVFAADPFAYGESLVMGYDPLAPRDEPSAALET